MVNESFKEKMKEGVKQYLKDYWPAHESEIKTSIDQCKEIDDKAESFAITYIEQTKKKIEDILIGLDELSGDEFANQYLIKPLIDSSKKFFDIRNLLLYGHKINTDKKE